MPKIPVVSGIEAIKALSKAGYDVDHQTGRFWHPRGLSVEARRRNVENVRPPIRGVDESKLISV